MKGYLKKAFQTKDLGLLCYSLGIEVVHSRGEIVLTQRKYVLDLLNEIDMLGVKLIDTPMKQNVNLNRDDILLKKQ